MGRWIIPALLVAAAGFSQSWNQQHNPIEGWLPARAGFEWAYWGFAEYGHRMQIDSIERTGDGLVYRISGMIEDVSDGESGADYSMGLKYIVTDSTLVMVQQSSRAMDNDFLSMELLRLPLEQGSSWTQTVTDWDGREVSLFCEVEEAEGNTLTVRYSDTDGPFYQLRDFETGTGMVTFEKLYIMPESSFEIGFTLYRDSY
jgi:hypothetical protein